MQNKNSLRCPLCKKPAVAGYKPFCSQGCKDRDLLKWLGEGYKLPGPMAIHGNHHDEFEED